MATATISSSMHKLCSALHANPLHSSSVSFSPLAVQIANSLPIQSRLRLHRFGATVSLAAAGSRRWCRESSSLRGPRAVRSSSYVRGVSELSKAAMAVPAVHEAWLYYEYGLAKAVLKLEEVAVPEVKPDQVLIKVKAAAINPIDFKRRTSYVTLNSPFPMRLCQVTTALVVKVGDAASKFKVGDEVYGLISHSPVVHPKQWGTLAPYTACEDRFLALKPKNLSFEEAPSLPLVILTATEGLQKAGCGAGTTVLALGELGGAGTHVIQVAKHVLKAAHVAAKKTDFLKGLRADEVIDYHTVDYTEKPERYDIVYDSVGPTKGFEVMKDGGVLISIVTKDLTYRHIVAANPEVLGMLNPFLKSGASKAIIDPKGKFKFSEVVQAFEYLETGRGTAKVVITLMLWSLILGKAIVN